MSGENGNKKPLCYLLIIFHPEGDLANDPESCDIAVFDMCLDVLDKYGINVLDGLGNFGDGLADGIVYPGC